MMVVVVVVVVVAPAVMALGLSPPLSE